MTALHWAQLFLKWFHVVAAITWIGQTYLFNWMERHMRAPSEAKGGATGELWMVHGGGFWRLEKLMIPARMPQHLLWFKWESGLTWISGLLLMVTYYYATPGQLVPEKGPVGHGAGVAVGLGALVLGWILYNAVWMSPLGRRERIGAAVSLVLIMAAAYGLLRVLGTRASFLHLGAMFGTIMAANVWMRIIPAQRAVIEARNAGTEPDVARAERAKRSSKHNTYLSIPVVLLMLSPEFVGGFANLQPWAMAGGLTLLGWIAARILRGGDHEPR